MRVQQVEVVGLEALQARLDLRQRRVARARRGRYLGGEEDLLAPGGHDTADARLALSVPVVDGGVEVVDPQLDRPLEDGRGLVCGVRQETAAAAEREDRDRHARPAEGAVRQLRGGGLAGQRRHRRDGADRQAASLEELAPYALLVLMLSPCYEGPTPAAARCSPIVFA